MGSEKITLQSVKARPVLVPLERPIVSKVGLFEQWPLILIDLYTEEGIIGRSYIQPYIKQSARYLVPAILDLAAARKGRPVAPFDDFRQGIGSLHLVGREGVSLIAVSGLDMAAWDALAKAANLPLAVLLGGTGSCTDNAWQTLCRHGPLIAVYELNAREAKLCGKPCTLAALGMRPDRAGKPQIGCFRATFCVPVGL